MKDQFSEDDIDIEEEKDDDNIDVNYDIASYPSDYTLSILNQMWKDGDIIIPNFQREFVWSIKQSSLLIDSFLRGLPVPPVFLYIDEKNKNVVIDGQQRILSIVFYMEGYFGRESTHGKRQIFRLTGIGDKNPFNNLKFDELDETNQRKLKQAVLRAINIRQLSPIGESTSAYHIFERLNTGGTPLRPQEIRNCVFMGTFNELLKTLNKDKNWRKIIGNPNLEKHLKDVEFILRIFSLIGNYDKYEKPMKEFLNKAMKNHESGETKKVKSFSDVFPKITDVIVSSIGEKPFHLRGPLNISALDAVMCVLIENYNKVDLKNLKTNYDNLVNDKVFIESTTTNTTDLKTVLARIKVVKKYLVK